MIDLIGIGCIAAAFVILLSLGAYERRKRIRELERNMPPSNYRVWAEKQEALERRDPDWRTSAPEWSRPSYYGSTRRKP